MMHHNMGGSATAGESALSGTSSNQNSALS